MKKYSLFTLYINNLWLITNLKSLKKMLSLIIFLNFIYFSNASLVDISFKVVDKVNDNLFLSNLQKTIEVDFKHVRLVVNDVNFICELNCFSISNDLKYVPDKLNFIQFANDSRPVSTIIRTYMFSKGIDIGYYMPFMPCECITNMFLVKDEELMICSSCTKEVVVLSTNGSKFQRKQMLCFVSFVIKFSFKIDLIFCYGGILNYMFNGAEFIMVKNLEFNSSILSGNFDQNNILVVHSVNNSFQIQYASNKFKSKILKQSTRIFENGFDFFLNFKKKPIFISKTGNLGYYNKNGEVESEKFSHIGLVFIRSMFRNIMPNNSCAFKFIVQQSSKELNSASIVNYNGYKSLYIGLGIVGCCLFSVSFFAILLGFRRRLKRRPQVGLVNSELSISSVFNSNLAIDNINF
jgi:hypothetical protein